MTAAAPDGRPVVEPPREPAGMARPTRMGWMTLALAVLLYLAGSNIGSGWVVLVTAAMAAAVAGDLWSVSRAARRTSATGRLRGPGAGSGGGPPRAGATSTLEVLVQRPVDGTVLHLGAQRAQAVLRGPATVDAPVVLPRGRLERVRLCCRTIGAFGLASVHRHVPVPVDAWCLPAVRPAVARVRAMVEDPAADGGPARRGRADVRGLRPYQPGDPRRAVHWRATARHGTLLVRETAADAGRRTLLSIEGGTWTAGALDLATAVVASLAGALTAFGDGAGEGGGGVEVAADGRRLSWGPAAEHHLAALPPATAVAARPLEPPDVAGAVHLCADGDAVVVRTAAGSARLADLEEVAAWLAGG